MLTLSLPPQHSIDDPAYWIAQNDPAWDHDRINEERDQLEEAARRPVEERHGAEIAALAAAGKPTADAEKAKAEAVAQACAVALASHPLAVYYSGKTRFSLDAPMTLPATLAPADGVGAVVRISDYFAGKPTLFEVKALGARGYREYVAQVRSPAYWIPVIQYGLVSIRDPDIKLEHNVHGLITEAQIDQIDVANRSILARVAAAIILLSHWEGEGDQGKP